MSGVVLPGGQVIDEDEYAERLEDALQQARNVIEFLHGCLTDERFKYAYPEQTEDYLNELKKLIEPRLYCFHSVHQADCESCQEHLHWLEMRAGWADL